MKHFPIALALLAAACAPPADNEAAESKDDASAVVAAGAANEPAVEPPAAAPAPVDPAAPPKVPAPSAPAPAERYTARGQEPGWALKIDRGRIDYQGNYGEKRIEVARPEPQPAANGRRYVTDRLTVVIVYKACNDAMSGHGYAHEVKVTADGETFDGCGGERQPNRDM